MLPEDKADIGQRIAPQPRSDEGVELELPLAHAGEPGRQGNECADERQEPGEEDGHRAEAGKKALGACPLKNTDVKIEVTGFLSRVRVTQEFENNFSEKIEAVYAFPLPNNAAVDQMTMRIGDRVWLRHTKSGELSEHVDVFHLVDVVDGRATVVGETPSYRGEGKVFL